MDRESRYIVIKQSDLAEMKKAGWPYNKVMNNLENALWQIDNFRKEKGKIPQNYVVVGEDWPMYEDTWKAIENWVDSSAYQSLQAQLEVYEEALKFYADEEIYLCPEYDGGVGTSQVEKEKGAKAKAALGGVSE